MKRRTVTQKLYGVERIAMLIDYLNHEKLSVISAKYSIDMSAPTGTLRCYGILPRTNIGRPMGGRTRRDWLICFIGDTQEERLTRLRRHVERASRRNQ